MSIHKELAFEDEICAVMSTQGWLFNEGDAADYDRARALFPADVITWVKETQPEAWERLEASNGVAAEAVLLDRLRRTLDDRGTLEVLRQGIELMGQRQPIALCQFKPALAMNPETLTRYKANRLRVVRQVRYSLHNEKCIDLVLFLNGIAVATVELKTDFTQSVEDAVYQYRFDRQPRPKGQSAAEPLLSFPNGALVHFAVSNSEVMMTTKLEGPATKFLPFNKGDNGGKGNPPNTSGHRTSYLWEEVWAKDSWLEILGRYLVTNRDDKKKISNVIFPRYHQLDATRKLIASVLEEGAGGKYLIQHSAGSGKTNSIAWSAHFLADLHDANHEKMFDSVLVVSDRNVLDAQLQEAIFDFQRTTGVVAVIKNERASKSQELAEALSAGKKIVVCTIQTFPFALQKVQELSATEGKRFAVIADEAHSSQTGATASKLKEVLSVEELNELEDGGEVATEDLLAAQMASRAAETGVTYVAFTATPKAKTLELFGRRPDPALPAGPNNLPVAFHVYSMRQAIEEGFILDVLQNYTTYATAFRLAHGGEEYDETKVERSAALKGIMNWVRLHPYNISQKVKLVVEHFRENVAPLLEGKAKAMVVVSSRLEAVRWKLAIEQYIKAEGYKIGTLVAFSGEVKDLESGADPFTEAGAAMNPGLKGRDIRETFKGADYQILLVANKFQTGFDQPLFCGMYVDKRLAGIQAVQTLSRLNRAHPGKDTTYILDFVNDAEEVLAAFKVYYQTAELENVTDPEIVLNLRAKLDAQGYYDQNEVDRVVKVLMNPKSTNGDLAASLEPVADRLLKLYKSSQERYKDAKAREDEKAEKAALDEMNVLQLFKGDMATYVRVYTFLSQMFDYGNTDLEKRALFFKPLGRLLDFGREREGIDLSQVELTHHHLVNKGKKTLPLSGDADKLQPMTETGGGSLNEKEKALLREIIQKVNDLFTGELTDDDRLVYVNSLKSKLLASDTLVQQATNNTKTQFSASPDLSKQFINAVMDALEVYNTMGEQTLASERIQKGLLDTLLGPAQLYEALRARGEELKG
tara:strand:- start:3887 stop:7003 length:3117 start_codon:yes stop_codon:yes gene_type:complete